MTIQTPFIKFALFSMLLRWTTLDRTKLSSVNYLKSWDKILFHDKREKRPLSSVNSNPPKRWTTLDNSDPSTVVFNKFSNITLDKSIFKKRPCPALISNNFNDITLDNFSPLIGGTGFPSTVPPKVGL
ncbi:hypothetical protein [Desulfatibacillum aliphaticivorans]|uniref:hypothetical protein n=1 Tax=Desulfatibacillum aliphaticivorans TaxID=218208 RepID=UPI00048826E6|nr:hypothetical protein [Desulfatibacillum aliphaticivorans]